MQSERKERDQTYELGFVGREQELRVFDEMLRDIQEGKLDGQKVLEFFGLPGIGKTRLLDEIRNKCVTDNIPFWNIDLAEMEPTDDLTAGLEELEDLSQEQGAVIFIDNTQTLMPLDNREQKEQVFSLVRQVARNDKGVLVVWSDQRYELFNGDGNLCIKLKMTAWELQRITQEDLEVKGIDTDTAERIIEHSAGYPPAVMAVNEALQRNPQLFDSELARASYEETFKALPEIADREAFEVLCTLERFSVRELRLAHFIFNDGKILETPDALDLMCQWGSLIEWSNEGGYKITETVRRVVANYFRFLPVDSLPKLTVRALNNFN